MKEIFKEILLSIKQHQLRSILTGFGIAWAMFILILLLGAGNGFRSGVINIFSDFSSNSIWITGSIIKKSTHNGITKGTRITFYNELVEKIKNRFSSVIKISPEIPIISEYSVKYKDNIGGFEVCGIGTEYLALKSMDIETGRGFNELDYIHHRRVVLIGEQVKKVFFNRQNPLGEYIEISGVQFKVIGTLKEGMGFSQILGQNSIYVPDITIKSIFNPLGQFYTFGVLINKNVDSGLFETELRNYLSNYIGFDKDDEQALNITNIQMQVDAFNTLFNSIDTILWVVGLCILLSGVIGIGNIMLVIVKERTQEIAIRKALGATPNSIIVLIISESVLITLFFGILGMLFGKAGLSMYNWIISTIQDSGQQVFDKASIDYHVIYLSLFIMILSGTLAGLYPARKASKIMPAEIFNTQM